MAEIHCRHFNGYKPCGLSEDCSQTCSHRDIPNRRIAIIQLEAMGSVLRATTLLPAILRKYPKVHVTWITKKPSDQLLLNNPLIDRLMTTSAEDLQSLSCLHFDAVFCLDKSLLSGGILKQMSFDTLFGFRIDARSGSAVPATAAAEELWQLGLSNQKKFFVNQKTEQQLMVEALELGPYCRDPYVMELSCLEWEVAQLRRKLWAPRGQKVLGLNTGCSAVIPYKKLSVDFHRRLIEHFSRRKDIKIVLLGGPEDTERNREIAYNLSHVILSPTQSGLRDGLCSVQACDVVVSGDSLGMHMAIALHKFVIAWFGPTCQQEVDLYDRGEKIISKAACSPCWKRYCDKKTMCYDMVDFDQVIAAIERGLLCESSLSKQLLSETSFFPSP